ncbi:unnamed protein product, partial [Ectocarpus fasciculatus]
VEDRGERAKGASAKKKGDKGSAKKKKQRESAKAPKNVEVFDDVDFEQDGGSSEAATRNNRDVLREEVMTQVLQDYRTKPVVEAKVHHQQFVWPLFRLRRLLGWAHVELHDAVLDGNIDIVKATLLRYIRKCPSKINDYDEEGRTALSLALMEQREDIADLIISIDDTDINAPDTITGLGPLHNAVLLDLGSSAQKLAFRGANINATDKVGMTPLMLGCRLGHEAMVDMLVDVFGAEIDPADKARLSFEGLRTLAAPIRIKRTFKAGWTCLFYATYHNESNIVHYLLMHGADTDHKDKRGMTAIDWGEHMRFGETCAIFSRFESQLAP